MECNLNYNCQNVFGKCLQRALENYRTTGAGGCVIFLENYGDNGNCNFQTPIHPFCLSNVTASSSNAYAATYLSQPTNSSVALVIPNNLVSSRTEATFPIPPLCMKHPGKGVALRFSFPIMSLESAESIWTMPGQTSPRK